MKNDGLEKMVVSGDLRKVVAAARYGIRPKDVDAVEPGEMALMLLVDRVVQVRGEGTR